MKIRFKDLIKAPLANLYDYAIFRYIIDSLDFSPEDVVLDIGCGTGIIEFVLDDKIKKMVGIDISGSAIDWLQRNYRKNKVEFYCMNATCSPPNILLGIFSKVICIDVLEHVESPQKILKFILDILQSEGQAIVTFPVNNLHHGNIIREDSIGVMLDALSCQYSIKYLRERFSISIFIYKKLRNFLPLKEADNFENTISYELLRKQERSILFKIVYFLSKLIIVFLSQITGSLYKEVNRDAQRCVLIINKIKK